MNVSSQVKPNSIETAADMVCNMSANSKRFLTAKPAIKSRQKGCPRTSRRCDDIQWVWRAKRHQTGSSGVLPVRSLSTALTNLYTTDHGMIECVIGRLPTIVLERNYFFVDGFRVNVSRLGSSLGCDQQMYRHWGLRRLRMAICMGWAPKAL